MKIGTIPVLVILLYVKSTEQKIFLCDSHAPCGCSQNSPSINARIVGGEAATADTWSWAVSLNIAESICGGSIISDSYVITAGHCVRGRRTSQITVHLGSTRLSRGQTRKVSHVYIHPEYYEDPFNRFILHDIAVLKLSKRLNLNDKTLAKICLPKNNDVLRDNAELVAVGWGTLREGAPLASDTLQQVTLKAVSSNSSWCRSVARNTTIQFCAGIMPMGGKDTCQGDSGGPLMLFNEDNQWELQGIVSYGIGCGRPSKPGVYAQVGYYSDWLNETMENTAPSMVPIASNNILILLLIYFLGFYIVQLSYT